MALRLSALVVVLLLAAATATHLAPQRPGERAAITFYPGELCLRHSRLHRCA